MSAKLTLIKEYRETFKTTLKDSYSVVTAAIEADAPTEEQLSIRERYEQLIDERQKAIIEVVFQTSPLKWDACEQVVQALVNKGYINL